MSIPTVNGASRAFKLTLGATALIGASTGLWPGHTEMESMPVRQRIGAQGLWSTLPVLAGGGVGAFGCYIAESSPLTGAKWGAAIAGVAIASHFIANEIGYAFD